MPLFDGNDEEKNETATPYRREEFRKQGTVALSRELVSVALIGAIVGVLFFATNGILKEFGVLVQYFFKFTAQEFTKEEFLVVRSRALMGVMWMVMPVFAVAMVAGIVASAAQVGFYITWEPLTPNWNRINPLEGMGRILSSKGLVEAVKSIFKTALVGWVVWSFLKKHANEAGMLILKTPGEGIILSLTLVGKLLLTLALTITVIAIADYFYQKFQLEKQMKMSRRELKEEFKLREGDPQIKQRIKAIQRRIAGRRMMENVPKATVIITNPTHLAIAIVYEDGMPAPRVLAKGAGFVAAKIRELAKANGIPLVENKPLARTLFKTVGIGHFVPRELFKAVAEVIAYVYRLKGLGRTA